MRPRCATAGPAFQDGRSQPRANRCDCPGADFKLGLNATNTVPALRSARYLFVADTSPGNSPCETHPCKRFITAANGSCTVPIRRLRRALPHDFLPAGRLIPHHRGRSTDPPARRAGPPPARGHHRRRMATPAGRRAWARTACRTLRLRKSGAGMVPWSKSPFAKDLIWEKRRADGTAGSATAVPVRDDPVNRKNRSWWGRFAAVFRGKSAGAAHCRAGRGCRESPAASANQGGARRLRKMGPPCRPVRPPGCGNVVNLWGPAPDCLAPAGGRRQILCASAGCRVPLQGVTYGPFAPNATREPIPAAATGTLAFDRMAAIGINFHPHLSCASRAVARFCQVRDRIATANPH
jgi:hypothetical protein